MNKIKAGAVSIGIMIGLVTGAVAAGVNEKMNEMFGAQSNVTSPGVVKGSVRGVISGGNVQIRNPIVTVSPWTIDPPNISAGCGGIDLYGGNLSFPSKEQYIATARAVVGNVGGYAFRTALKQTCDLCESVMSQIQETVEALNIDSLNSCTIAKGVVGGMRGEGMPESMAQSGRQLAAIWKTATGDEPDMHAANNYGGESPAKDAVKDPKMAQLLQGNWIWDSMEKTQAFDWLGSDRRTREEIMSLIGTVITCVPGVNGCEDQGKDLTARTLEPKLRLQDFLAPKAQRVGEVPVYSCNDDNCLNPNVKAMRELGASPAELIRDKLLGVDGEPGLMQRMVMSGRKAGTMTASDLMLVANTKKLTAVAASCMKAGEVGQGYAELIVEGLAPVVASDVMYRTAEQSIVHMIADLSARKGAVAAQEAVELLKMSRAELSKQNSEIIRAAQTTDLLNMAIQRCGTSPVAAAAFGNLMQ